MTLSWPREPGRAGREATRGTDPQGKPSLSPSRRRTLSSPPPSSPPPVSPGVTSAGHSPPAPRYLRHPRLPPPPPSSVEERGAAPRFPEVSEAETPLHGGPPRVSMGCTEVPPPKSPAGLRAAFPREGNGSSPRFPQAP
ncbi:basic proline-rich protein-like [Grus americana]|uniref:basic proline-rich protein-like n=1 Tax=Grus americana TaxID=9117 RepID=UPI002407BD5E|nr:basic proline-rich protein-like [Grus americana]